MERSTSELKPNSIFTDCCPERPSVVASRKGGSLVEWPRVLGGFRALHSGWLLLLMAASAQAQSSSDPSGSLQYRISATLTDSCPVQKTVNVHPLRFDFHNASCQSRKHVSERKLPTLPQSPRSKNVRIAGYHFSDWSDGLLSTNTRNAEHIGLSFTAATLTASGW